MPSLSERVWGEVMNKKNKNDRNGFVFSTDPNFKFEEDETPVTETLPPHDQKLKMETRSDCLMVKHLTAGTVIIKPVK